MADEIVIDRGHNIPVYSPVCTFCERLFDEGRTCEAFPNGIPLEIWEGKNKHRSPYSGDDGITFKKMKA